MTQEANGNAEMIRNIPLIPLRDLVIFPSTLVPFIIGRSSSVQALDKAMERDKLIFLSAQMDASIDNPTPKDIYSLGVTPKIIKKSEDQSPEIKELLKRVLALFEDYLKLNQNANIESIIPALRDTTPERITDIIASHLYLPLEEKQNILERINTPERTRRWNYLSENEILKIHSKLRRGGARWDRQKAAGKKGQT